MANGELIHLLKQGTSIWNTWRKEHPDEKHLDLAGVDLSNFELAEANLSGVNFHSARLRHTNLQRSNLSLADMTYVDLGRADLRKADLRRAIIMFANLEEADLSYANLSHTSLVETDLSWANLHQANLTSADLTGSILCGTLFLETHVESVLFDKATMYQTVFAGLDLSKTGGLQMTLHLGPSHLSGSTLVRSHGSLPETFLRGTGMPDRLIQSLRSLSPESIEYATCYIIYSRGDQAFATQLHADLHRLGLRCWLSPHSIDKRGQWTRNPLRNSVEASLRPDDKVIVILSIDSIDSPWIEPVVSSALEREARAKHQVLFLCQSEPIMTTSEHSWLLDLQRTHPVIDFSSGETQEMYTDKVLRLLMEIQASQ
jgi:uncharacterized protein YjbI with pentapeptide repeats